jgi:hypothetical protein
VVNQGLRLILFNKIGCLVVRLLVDGLLYEQCETLTGVASALVTRLRKWTIAPPCGDGWRDGNANGGRYSTDSHSAPNFFRAMELWREGGQLAQVVSRACRAAGFLTTTTQHRLFAFARQAERGPRSGQREKPAGGNQALDFFEGWLVRRRFF